MSSAKETSTEAVAVFDDAASLEAAVDELLSSGFNQAVAIGAIGIMVHLHIHNFVDNLYVQGMYLHLAIILGLSAIIYEQQH